MFDTINVSMLAGKSGVIGVVVCVALLGLPVTFCQDLPFPSKVAPPPPAPPRNWCSDHIDFVSHYHGFAQSHGGKDHRNWYIRADRNPYVPPPGKIKTLKTAMVHSWHSPPSRVCTKCTHKHSMICAGIPYFRL